MVNVGDTAAILGIIYGAVAVVAWFRIRGLLVPLCAIDTVRLFALSVFGACVLRSASWVGLACLSYQHVELPSGSTPLHIKETNAEDDDVAFVESAVFVLFDLPDFIVLSVRGTSVIESQPASPSSSLHFLALGLHAAGSRLG